LWGDLRCIGAPHVACNAGQWYYVEFHLDWENKQFDYFIDDELIASNVPFRSTTVDKISKAYLYNKGTDTDRHWWDDFVFSSGSTNDGLVAHYPFNGNADDESGNGHDGTVNGAQLTTDRFGNPDSAYHFDGVNDFIDCGNDDAFELGGSGAVSVWVSPNINTESGVVISKDGSGYNDDLAIGFDPHPVAGKDFSFTFNRTVERDIPFLSTNVETGRWTHVVSQWDSSGMKLFVDGALIAENSKVCKLDANGIPLYIGQMQEIRFFDGDIDDIRAYDRALSAAEIQDLYNEDNSNDSWWSASPTSGTVPPGTRPYG